jgi:probable rRNA maturation factor
VTHRPEGVAIHLNAPGGHDLPRGLLRSALELLLDEEGVRDGELSVTFLRDGPMRKMNRDWLGHDRVTDVLAFALHGPGEPLVGDVYVGVEEAERQAREHGVARDEELARLALHGALHVLGYDHPDDPEERAGAEQYRRQEEVLRRVLTP